jgi:hypothetical protein
VIPQEVAEGIMLLAHSVGKKLDEEQVGVVAAGLSNFQPHDVFQACRELALTADRFPATSQIRKAVRDEHARRVKERIVAEKRTAEVLEAQTSRAWAEYRTDHPKRRPTHREIESIAHRLGMDVLAKDAARRAYAFEQKVADGEVDMEMYERACAGGNLEEVLGRPLRGPLVAVLSEDDTPF